MKLSFNVGGLDRIFRLILGVVLIALAYFGVLSETSEMIAYVIATVAIVSGVVKFCPSNAIFGINTNTVKSSKSTE